MHRLVGYLYLYLLTCSVISVMSEERPSAISSLSQGVFDFSQKLFNEVKSENKNGIFSGYSLATVLSMTSLGAKGKSLKELRLALGLPRSKKLVKLSYSQISRRLTSDKNVTLEIANGIFPQKDFQIRKSFIKIAKNHFKAGVYSLDYAVPHIAINAINSWVEGKTHNKIKDLFSSDSVDSSTVSVFVNAVYFKGNWKNKFDSKLTRNKDFKVSLRKTVSVPTMHAPKMNIASTYIESLKSEIIKLPYEGDRFSMIIFLPDETFGLSELEAQLASSSFDPRILDSITYKTNRPVYMPKFKMESSYDLKDSLKKLGISRIFSDKSDLSSIGGAPGELYISSVVQKAIIEVNEEGSEAAAASGMIMMMRSMPLPPTPILMDHPFVFMIWDQVTGMVIFSGRVLNPLESS